MTSKPASTSAATTVFCAMKIEGPGGFLWIDGNGKITAGNGTLDEPKPNAFSLVQIADCPGSTEVCRASCYVHGLEKHAPDTHALYRHNSRSIREVLATRPGPWAELMGAWITANCPGGFRWHVSGDVFSREYAAWIAFVCNRSPNVRHWIYTRSFEFVDALVPVSTVRGGNLAVNLSADRNNYHDACRAATRYGFRLCYLTADGELPRRALAEGDVIFPDYSLRCGTQAGKDWFAALPPTEKAMVCPVDYHGKSERRRCGPCAKCLV